METRKNGKLLINRTPDRPTPARLQASIDAFFAADSNAASVRMCIGFNGEHWEVWEAPRASAGWRQERAVLYSE